ncbi:MAG: RHS repeat-associated core domain-containing protein [Candidatus Kryptoniota bacterium]
MDGTTYTFGDPSGNNDYVKIKGNPLFQTYPYYQEYEFPYRWNLTTIRYPDGSATKITYAVGPNQTSYYRRYESVMIDRTQTQSSGVGNYFGNITGNIPQSYVDQPLAQQSDYALYSYSHPDTLYTDTHYAVFKISTPTADSTARNCRLDTLILCERNTNKELKRVVFHYATSANMDNWDGSISVWNSNERLNTDQLTLTGITVTDLNDINDVGITACPEQYSFSYTANAKIDPEFISTNGRKSGGPEWPGYFDNSTTLDTTWRIKSVTVPTGGTYTYTYEPDNVNFDPEGLSPTSNYWSFSAQPRCRLKSKRFDDGLGGTPRIWNYTYSPEVIYDPPSDAYAGEYVPQIYRSWFTWDSTQYYKSYRGCEVGHRWVLVTNPDSTWKKYYYTSSYNGPGINNASNQGPSLGLKPMLPVGQQPPPPSDPDTLESQPDIIPYNSNPNNVPIGSIILTSKAPCRGLVWKEESGQANQSPSTMTRYYYTFLQEGELMDRYDYYGMLNNNQTAYQYIMRTSMWARLDSVMMTQDGVTATTAYQYNTTPREAYLGDFGNGLVSIKTEEGSNVNRETQYAYAYTKYSGMMESNNFWLGPMLSQLYSTTVRNATSGIDMSKEFTTWNQFGPAGYWLPWEKFVWKGLPTDVAAPADTSGSNVIRQQVFSYDNSGYSDVLSSTDANGYATAYYYSSTSNLYSNDALGLSKGYVTGAVEPISSPILEKSYQYDQYGNVTSETDENGNATTAQYDNLGRIATVTNPLSQLVNQFSYDLVGNGISSTNPNSITATSFRSSSDYTIANSFFDGAGYEREKMVSFGSSDIVTPTTYDPMWRVSYAYKPYQVTLASPHTYDPNYSSNDINYYNTTVYNGISDSYPYTQNQYYLDGTGRVKNTIPQGNAWQNHFLSYLYGANATNDNAGFANNTLYKTSITDENGTKRLEFRDIFGNLVQTVTDSANLILTTKLSYDVLGNLTQSIPPDGSSYNTTYIYNKMNQLTQKASPDAGTVQYLYDNNGNLRLTKDANHTSASENSVNLGGNGGSTSGSFYLAMPGLVALSVAPTGGSGTGLLSIKPHGSSAVLTSITSTTSQVNSSVHLPIGSYDYTLTCNGATYAYSITCSTGYEFIYKKYDAINREIEEGEYLSNSVTGDFTQANANNPGFPTSSVLVWKKIFYDSASTNPLAAGQRNVKGRISYTESWQPIGLAQRTFYSYDPMGRIEWMVINVPNTSAKQLTYSYDIQGNITEKGYVDEGSSSADFYTSYTYDPAGRLLTVSTSPNQNMSGATQEATYQYFASGKPERLQLANAQGVDYRYNERDWLMSINNQNLDATDDPGHDGSSGSGVRYVDRFGEGIGYNLPGSVVNPSGQIATPQYNGNISWLMYQMYNVGYTGPAGTATLVGWTHSYDGANRLTKGDFGYYIWVNSQNNNWYPTTAYDMPTISFDNNGNIRQLTRYASDGGQPPALLTLTTRPSGQSQAYGAVSIVASSYTIPAGDNDVFQASSSIHLVSGFRASGGSTFHASISSSPQGNNCGPMDQLTYNYQSGTNKLIQITDAVPANRYSFDLDSQPANNYAYDGNGNMIQDLGDVLSFVIYDIDNHPLSVYTAGGLLYQYAYDANGNRMQKNINGTYTFYINGPDGKTEVVDWAPSGTNITYNIWAGDDNIGQVRINSGTNRYYYIKDHLGSIRVTVDASANVVAYNDYYPFGEQMDLRNEVNLSDARYKYTSKERDVETGYDYFGARYYDSRIGRWLSVDPLMEKYPEWSPYSYAMCNPIRLIDTDGRRVTVGTALERFCYWLTGIKTEGLSYAEHAVVLLKSTEVGRALYKTIDQAPQEINIREEPILQSESEGAAGGLFEATWDPKTGNLESGIIKLDPANIEAIAASIASLAGADQGDVDVEIGETLGHELGHAKTAIKNPKKSKEDASKGNAYADKEEASPYEEAIRNELLKEFFERREEQRAEKAKEDKENYNK